MILNEMVVWSIKHMIVTVPNFIYSMQEHNSNLH